ncbi:MAG: transcriptional repressor [Actinobacteria bacterium]|nr:transcriptional repressor [Actinomycetota bacterium]
MTPNAKPIIQRQTRQRTAVSELLDGLDEFKSAQELHDILRHRGEPIGLTTVYRSLQNLTESGEVDCLVADDGETRYRKCGAAHHHHLVCRQCGATVEIAGPAVEKWADTMAAEHGYTEVSHTLEIFGLCQSCTQATA